MRNEVRLRGPWLINRSRLDTSTASQFGTIPKSSIVSVAVDGYAFWCDMRMVLTLDLFIVPDLVFSTPPPPGAPDAPRFTIKNDDSMNDRDYLVGWRFINP